MGLRVDVTAIEHSRHRYPTCGDWFYDSLGDWHVRVSRMADWRYEFLVAFHELIEMALCRYSGISEEEVTDFDKDFEANKPDGSNYEPGDDIAAPYHWQHQMATMFERVMARLLGVDWREYEKAIDAL